MSRLFSKKKQQQQQKLDTFTRSTQGLESLPHLFSSVSLRRVAKTNEKPPNTRQVVHIFSPSALEAKAGKELSEFEASQGYIRRPCLKNEIKKKNLLVDTVPNYNIQ